MFRDMRIKKQLLSYDETISIFKKGTAGTLALLGDNDYPYAIPMNYVYSNGKIFFHSAKEGHKTDAINKNDRASFCVIAEDTVIPEECTTYFRSAVAFGKIKIIENDQLKRAAIEKLAEKYTSDTKEKTQTEINRAYERFCVIELNIEHMTGKESAGLAEKRK